MSTLRLHWHPGDDIAGTLCGTGRQVASSEAGITCLSCQYILAQPWHGSVGGYRNHKCRCAPCTEANRVYQVEHRERLARRPVPVHGTENAYSNYTCRCPVCRAAHTQGARNRRDARVRKMEQFNVRSQ